MIHDEHIETMRDNYDDHGAELAAKTAEIERLRELLLDAADALEDEGHHFDDEDCDKCALVKRVREALPDDRLVRLAARRMMSG